MQEKLYVRAVMLLITLLIIAVIYTWYPKIIGEKEEDKVIPAANTSFTHITENHLLCERGEFQSPINIKIGNIETDNEKDVQLKYNPTLLKIEKGHKTVHAKSTSNNNILKIGEKTFTLVDIHFHHPSEHTINGQHFPLEMHLVHENKAGDKAVVAALIQEGKENKNLAQVFTTLPNNISQIKKEPIDLSKVILSKTAFHYIGSLTTPPCTEGVEWIVIKEPIEISKNQLKMYTKQFPKNNRPTQDLNNRKIEQIEVH